MAWPARPAARPASQRVCKPAATERTHKRRNEHGRHSVSSWKTAPAFRRAGLCSQRELRSATVLIPRPAWPDASHRYFHELERLKTVEPFTTNVRTSWNGAETCAICIRARLVGRLQAGRTGDPDGTISRGESWAAVSLLFLVFGDVRSMLVSGHADVRRSLGPGRQLHRAVAEATLQHPVLCRGARPRRLRRGRRRLLRQ